MAQIRFATLPEARGAAMTLLDGTPQGDTDIWLKRTAYGWLLRRKQIALDGTKAIHYARRDKCLTITEYPAGHPDRLPGGQYDI